MILHIFNEVSESIQVVFVAQCIKSGETIKGTYPLRHCLHIALSFDAYVKQGSYGLAGALGDAAVE